MINGTGVLLLTIVVFNKIDAFTYVKKDEDDLTPMTRENYSLEDLKNTWMAKIQGKKTVFVSAKKKENITELRDVIFQEVLAINKKRYPYREFYY